MNGSQPIVLFDGVCNFCDAAVNFVIAHDKAGIFRFAPLQSNVGRELVAKHQIPAGIDSVILIDDGGAFVHSDAAIRIARRLGGGWSILGAFRVIPRFIRDWSYKLFAKYRYRLFGKKDACMMPTPEVRSRFLADADTVA
ncbi:MAG TPA: thiol-disulfide oxidoreductase DCC family protein [Pyrinomonadaceae bacterium]|nr:thiol-disulfide oxidoreductase DCC family protein [Pyrinomonadaceae bacterium]